MNTRNVLDFLEQSTRQYPNNIAVEDEYGACSYAELHTCCQRIGSALIPQIHHGTPVAVLMENSILSLSAFWGIVYAGAYYVMLNPQLPRHRLQQITDILNADFIITDQRNAVLAGELYPTEKILRIETLIQSEIDLQCLETARNQTIDTDPLYAMFTSGSTGIPKGVIVSHRSVIDFIEQFAVLFHFRSTDRFANQAPFDFDVSVKDIYTTAFVGATLVITPRALFSQPTALLDWLCDHRVTTLVWAVSALCLISTFHGLDYRTPSTIRHILFSGEVMPYKHLQTWMQHLPDAEYVNLYGPTEITCNCTYHVLNPKRDYRSGIPIGKSFLNEQVFLIDEKGCLIERTDVIGEICVRGSTLALGYLSAPEQTADAFVQNPCNSSYPERIYRTGDLAQYNENMELVFCGRRDNQIKYMGHRIELQEVEQAIEQINGIERCCCVYDEQKHRLYAFYMGNVSKQVLYSMLRERLPAFMVPSSLFRQHEFPVTKNGKIDKVELLSRKDLANE